MQSLAIAVFGTDQRILNHIERIRRSDRCHLVAIVDPTAQHAALAAELGCHYFTDVVALLRSEICDAMLVCHSTQLDKAAMTHSIIMAMLGSMPLQIESEAIASLEMAQELAHASEVMPTSAIFCITQNAALNPVVQRLQLGIDQASSELHPNSHFPCRIAGNITFPVPASLFSKINLSLNSAYHQRLIYVVAVLRCLAGDITTLRAERMQPVSHNIENPIGQLRLTFHSGVKAILALSRQQATGTTANDWIRVSTGDPEEAASQTHVSLALTTGRNTADAELRYFCQQVSPDHGSRPQKLKNDLSAFIENMKIVQAIFISAICGKPQQVLPAIHEKPEITGTLKKDNNNRSTI